MIRKSDIDAESYDYLSLLESQLKVMILEHDIYALAPDMISYHLKKALDYCERLKNELTKRVHFDED